MARALWRLERLNQDAAAAAGTRAVAAPMPYTPIVRNPEDITSTAAPPTAMTNAPAAQPAGTRVLAQVSAPTTPAAPSATRSVVVHSACADTACGESGRAMTYTTTPASNPSAGAAHAGRISAAAAPRSAAAALVHRSQSLPAIGGSLGPSI